MNMNEEIYEGTPAKEDVLIGTDSGYNRYRRPDGSTYVHYPYSRMATVTAYSAKDKNGQSIRTADGKLITGKTQAEADRNRFRYDMNHWVEANRRKTAHLPEGWRERIVTPDMNTFNAITGGVFNLTPIQVGRGVYNLSQGKDPGFILGNSGVVSKEYAQEHPWLALGANVLGEGLTGGFIYGTPKLYNAGVKNIRNYRMARAFDRAVQESNPQTILNHTFPGLIGLGPKLTFTGYHASFEENLIPDYWFKGWSQKKHGAPNGFYTAAGDGPISGFLTERPYVHHFESTFDKPMVLIGEVPTPLKNATRNQIEEFAKSLGSDGIIYYGIADNKMRNQTIAKTLHPDVIVSNVSYTDKKPFKLIFNTDKTGAIVFRGGNPKPRYSKYPYYYTTDPKYAANFGDVKMGILDVSNAIPAKYRFINDSYIDMNFGESQLLYNGKQPLLLQGHDVVTGEFIPSRGIEYATYLPKFTPLKLSRYTDNYGKEIISTPYKGSDDDLINVVIETHKNTLKDYFTNPKKIELIKRTMNWGDAKINELRSELMRTLGKTSKVEIKGLEDGFNNIALHQGTLVGTGKDARMLHTVTLNKDRIPNILMAEEGAIHEVGAHGKTASMNAADFGKGGNSDLAREAFPRLAELILKNKELADLILVLNRKGKLLNSVNKPSGLELHFDKHNIPWERYPKYQDALKRFRYVTSPPEIEARAYTGQLFERLHSEAPKTTNILLLEEYFTPESVENFKKAVLGISPIIGLSSLQDNNKTESKKQGGKLIKRRNIKNN